MRQSSGITPRPYVPGEACLLCGPLAPACSQAGPKRLQAGQSASVLCGTSMLVAVRGAHGAGLDLRPDLESIWTDAAAAAVPKNGVQVVNGVTGSGQAHQHCPQLFPLNVPSLSFPI